ncbi:hypothetical protein ACVWYQ_006038 [Bradyrhizobium sp. USDA 3397]
MRSAAEAIMIAAAREAIKADNADAALAFFNEH